jgi:hypothetical protein
MILAPTWNWRSKCLIAVSAFFWLCFSSATVILSKVVMYQNLREFGVNSLSGLILILLMVIASVVWARGFIRLFNVHYHAYSDGSFLVWREQRHEKFRETKIDLTSIESVMPVGLKKMGYILQIETKTNRYRLGTFLTLNDIDQLSKLIEESRPD